ncbi:DUF4384 domain-containing protein [Ruegeria marina]|uniref:DUF4384 domain-containing protein n=1 Tax=Ruegeria marina TaxID=639004 RepID=A0A1G7CXR1_9RHOB|nr:DUF4384 domain-containing protein [Ruegeria marina]SDE43570.1 protein of unknown function [Ruegeria marina]
MTRLTQVAAGGAASLLLHGGFLLAVVALLSPRPIPQQDVGPAELTMAVLRVPQVQGKSATPDASDAPEAEAGSRQATATGIPTGLARPVFPDGMVLSPAPPHSVSAAAVAEVAVETVTQLTARHAPLPSVTSEAPLARPASVPVQNAALAQPVADDLGAVLPSMVQIGQATPAADPVHAHREMAETIPGSRPVAIPLDSLPAPPLALLPGAAPNGEKVKEAVPAVRLALPSDPPQVHLSAAFDWSAVGLPELDAAGLLAVEAFLAPSDATGVRDGIRAAMAGVDCARLRTEFDPESGRIRLLGHVPEEAARAPAMAALRTQLGAVLPVEDGLRILPRPQCNVLGQIAATGLAQSEEQYTDAAMIGAQGFAREYAFSEGDLLRIDLTAPDYDAYIYVDYYDAAGQVLHLAPSLATPRKYQAGTVFSLPAAEAGQTPLKLEIAPPFGQDIAVTIAVSAPLYTDPRPVVEPAADYLVFLQNALERLSSSPDFQGEWAYLFVATGPQKP